MRRIIGFCIAMLLTGTAFAVGPLEGGFTAEEAVSVENCRLTIVNALTLVEKYCGTGSIATDCKQAQVAAYEFTQACGWLLHVNVAAQNATGETLLAGPRGTVVAEAWKDLDRGIFELNLASGFSLKVEFTAAMAKAAAINRSLAYATPWPIMSVNPLGTDPNNQFGPHGDYPKAQQNLWKSMQYGSEALKAWFDGQNSGVLPACQSGGLTTGMANQFARALKRSITEVMFMSAHLINEAPYVAFRTPAEEALPQEPRRALTEIHMINMEETTSAIRLLAGAQSSGAGCIGVYAGLGPASGTAISKFFGNLRDAWDDLDAWNSVFNRIK